MLSKHCATEPAVYWASVGKRSMAFAGGMVVMNASNCQYRSLTRPI
jgi:hypothetical protein